jgi:hypothetical protein
MKIFMLFLLHSHNQSPGTDMGATQVRNKKGRVKTLLNNPKTLCVVGDAPHQLSQ